MRCGHADGSWEDYDFDFGVNFSQICLFLCSSLMRFFVVQVFFVFEDSVWLVKSS